MKLFTLFYKQYTSMMKLNFSLPYKIRVKHKSRIKMPWLTLFLSCLLFTAYTNPSYAQPEVTAWGNITGIRVEGQLMEFETSIRLVSPDWAAENQTYKERQRPSYQRDGKRQIIETQLDSITFIETVEETGSGQAKVNIKMDALAEHTLAGAYFCIELPARYYAQGNVQLINPAELKLSEIEPNGKNLYLRAPAEGVRIVSATRQLEVSMGESSDIFIKKSDDKQNNILIYIPIFSGNVGKGKSAEKNFMIKASGEIDTQPITLTLFPSQTGRPFDGLGGNFRIQNPKNDPQVIAYSLENLRVAWSRVELPWRQWHPEESVDPLEAARKGTLDPKVEAAMEMAKKLNEMGIPVITAAWFPPAWAAKGPLDPGRHADGYFGNFLDSTKMDQVYESIGSYHLFLKEKYGVEAVMFSFNESDLGIDVRQTAEQHTFLIKGLGAWFASNGLSTKMLLGDTSDANSYDFINDAMADPAAHPYIGAVSFHSWRGWETETLLKWDAAAARMGVPLLVGEGSIDAAAWRYPQIFEEQIYALEEINLYIRMLAICEPLTILQWQLTADYSPLVGGGIFGNDGPLRPTRRFWNLKQLASSPQGLYAMPITTDQPFVTCAALGDNEKGSYTIHLVNNGASREVTVTGLPEKAKRFKVYTTSSDKNMKEGKVVKASNGQAKFTADAASYVTLISEK